ncbi:MAG: hypothetical protein B0W54_22250 [Cellvibrio sp. 79]|nr:MAG: hypothetical protein B0W54_22250 [Cellvibrio sp. 79]
MRSDLNKLNLTVTYVVVTAPFLAAWGYNRAHFMWMAQHLAALTCLVRNPHVINTDFETGYV